MNPYLFWFLAGAILLPAIAVVVSRNLFHAGLCLIATFLGVAALYVGLSAPFMAGVQVMVYAGAIAVILLFAFMLTHDLMRPQLQPSRLQKGSSLAVCALLTAVFLRLLYSSGWESIRTTEGTERPLKEIAAAVVTEHLLSFQVLGLLLTVALIGAVVIARKEAYPLAETLVEEAVPPVSESREVSP